MRLRRRSGLGRRAGVLGTAVLVTASLGSVPAHAAPPAPPMDHKTITGSKLGLHVLGGSVGGVSYPWLIGSDDYAAAPPYGVAAVLSYWNANTSSWVGGNPGYNIEVDPLDLTGTGSQGDPWIMANSWTDPGNVKTEQKITHVDGTYSYRADYTLTRTGAFSPSSIVNGNSISTSGSTATVSDTNSTTTTTDPNTSNNSTSTTTTTTDPNSTNSNTTTTTPVTPTDPNTSNNSTTSTTTTTTDPNSTNSNTTTTTPVTPTDPNTSNNSTSSNNTNSNTTTTTPVTPTDPNTSNNSTSNTTTTVTPVSTTTKVRLILITLPASQPAVGAETKGSSPSISATGADGAGTKLAPITPWTGYYEGDMSGAQPTQPALPDTVDSSAVDGAAILGVWERELSGSTPDTISVNWEFTPPSKPKVPDVTGLPESTTGMTSADPAFAAAAGDAAAVKFQCKLDDEAWQDCDPQSPPKLTGLAEGSHSFSVKALNSVGVEGDPAVKTWKVDLTAAVPTVLGKPADSPATTAKITFSGEDGATFECAVDKEIKPVSLDTGWTSCASPLELTGLAKGAHKVLIRQTDPVGNISAPATVTWTVTEPAVVPPAAPPKGPSVVTAPVVVTSVTGDTLMVGCKLSTGRVNRCDITLTASRSAISGNQRSAAEQVVIGQGGKTFTGAEASGNVAVPVTLNAAGKALAKKGGPVTVQAAILPVGSSTVLHSTTTTRLVSPKLIVVSGALTFDSRSAKLKKAGKRYLNKLRKQLTSINTIRCAGFTDNVGSAIANRKLGKARAKAVCKYLTRGTKIRYRTVSFGERRPRASNKTAHGRALNRRTELKLTYRQ